MKRFVVCPYCLTRFEATSETETEAGCEDCGSHPAEMCPECSETVDMVYHDYEVES